MCGDCMDNFHVNAFVQRLFARIAAEPARFAPFWVRRSEDPAEPPVLFIDPAVYTRNRAFRLYLSSKFGKEAFLRAVPRHAVAELLRRRGLQVQASAAFSQAPANGTGAVAAAAATAADGRQGGTTGTGGGAAAGGSNPRGPPASQAASLLPPELERQVAPQVFFATLITATGRVDRVLKVPYGQGGATGPLKANPAAPGCGVGSGGPANAVVGVNAAGCGAAAGEGAFRYGPSPFPGVEAFIESVCCEALERYEQQLAADR
ncbi:hypothetical protein GPECTOR_14g158 [Gonium pectorale]|uniref:DNA-directed primase/polymerase protein n=1 Tax=Gonium pectorale TaxID=33097 RepID=A0A150GM97_GONPE|nr:hypothetical protein GPECTOR_14g158 [Gonium pectorale]|eukprot:KXZ50911.1 hypothetical protein GPECTOR_14g158 [Gonium pectorale]